VKQGLVEEKFRKLITDESAPSPTEIQQDFKSPERKSEADYVLIKPAGLQKINPSDSDIKAYYEQNKAKFPDSGKARNPLRAARPQPSSARNTVGTTTR